MTRPGGRARRACGAERGPRVSPRSLESLCRRPPRGVSSGGVSLSRRLLGGLRKPGPSCFIGLVMELTEDREQFRERVLDFCDFVLGIRTELIDRIQIRNGSRELVTLGPGRVGQGFLLVERGQAGA